MTNSRRRSGSGGKRKSDSRRKSTGRLPDISRRDHDLSDTSRPRGVAATRDRNLTPKIELSAPDNRRSIDDEPNISRRDLERDSLPSTRSTLRRQAERESASEENSSEDDRVLLRTSFDIDGRETKESGVLDDGIVKKATQKQLDDLRHFSKPNLFLKGRRAEIRPMLTTLFDTLNCDFSTAITTKSSLYSLREAELKRLRKDLDNALKGDKGSAEALFLLLSKDNPISRVLLKNPDAFGQILNRLPNTEDSHTNIEKIENFLVNQQNYDMPLTMGLHEICFKKKTEILENVIEGLLSKSTNPKLKELRDFGKDNYWKILIDGSVHNRNNKHFYDRSRGFMASMMKGLMQVVEGIDRPLDTAFVKELHTAAIELVVDETSLTRPILDIIKKVKGIPPHENMPGLLNDVMKTLTDEQKSAVEKEKSKIVMGRTNFQEQGVKRVANEWGVTRTYTPTGMQELATLRTDLDLQAGAAYFSVANTKFPNDPTDVAWRAGGTLDRTQLPQTVESLMDYVINKAYQEITTAKQQNNQDAVIEAIIACCRGLGVIHPFRDANGRLIMFLILNKLLMEQGMPPTILDDQGLMIGKSKAELIALIKAGQKLVTGEEDEDEDIPPLPEEDEDED
jgi:hypothetical protein